MRVLLENVNVNSSSGPNSFGRRLMIESQKIGHVMGIDVFDPDVQLSFIMALRKLCNHPSFFTGANQIDQVCCVPVKLWKFLF